VLSEEVLESLGCELQVSLLLGVDHGVALNNGCVDTTVVKLGYQVLRGSYVIRGWCILRLPSCLSYEHLIEWVQVDLNHIRYSGLPEEAIKSSNI